MTKFEKILGNVMVTIIFIVVGYSLISGFFTFLLWKF